MRCPICFFPRSKITDVRDSASSAKKRIRRRECLACKGRWSSEETILNGTIARAKRQPSRAKTAPKKDKDGWLKRVLDTISK